MWKISLCFEFGLIEWYKVDVKNIIKIEITKIETPIADSMLLPTAWVKLQTAAKGRDSNITIAITP